MEVSDDERREVARRLRELCLNPWEDAACEIAQCVGIACCNSECHGSDETPECAMALCDRLADLIKPGEPKVRCVAEVKVDGERLEKLIHDAVVEVTGVDRDALLALADEMDAYTKCDDERCGREMPPRVIHDFARRIRKALGVES